MVALAVNCKKKLDSWGVTAASVVAASQSRETNLTVWGYTTVVTKAVQQPLNLVSAWTEWKSCGNDFLWWGEAFGLWSCKFEGRGGGTYQSRCWCFRM